MIKRSVIEIIPEKISAMTATKKIILAVYANFSLDFGLVLDISRR